MFLFLLIGHFHLLLQAQLALAGCSSSWTTEWNIIAVWSLGCRGDQRVKGTEAGPLQKQVILKQENPLPDHLEPNGDQLGSGNHQLGFYLKCAIIRYTQSQTPHGNLVAGHMFGTPLVFTNAPGLWSRRPTRENAGTLNRECQEIGREPLLFVDKWSRLEAFQQPATVLNTESESLSSKPVQMSQRIFRYQPILKKLYGIVSYFTFPSQRSLKKIYNKITKRPLCNHDKNWHNHSGFERTDYKHFWKQSYFPFFSLLKKTLRETED